MTMTQHTSATITRVREMHAAGWRQVEIARVLHREGTPVAESTIYHWINEEAAEAKIRRDRLRRARASAARLGKADHSPEFRVARIHALRRAGLSLTAIAKVMRLDYGEELSQDKLRRMVKEAA